MYRYLTLVLTINLTSTLGFATETQNVRPVLKSIDQLKSATRTLEPSCVACAEVTQIRKPSNSAASVQASIDEQKCKYENLLIPINTMVDVTKDLELLVRDLKPTLKDDLPRFYLTVGQANAIVVLLRTAIDSMPFEMRDCMPKELFKRAFSEMPDFTGLSRKVMLWEHEDISARATSQKQDIEKFYDELSQLHSKAKQFLVNIGDVHLRFSSKINEEYWKQNPSHAIPRPIR
jgi:hypothetical protein